MSATPGRRVSVAVLRDAVRREAAATSTHKAATSIGLGQPWLRKFLQGAEPHPATLDVLLAWYDRHTRARAESALDVLVESAPPGEQARLRRALVADLRDAHARGGTEPPAWLTDD